MTKIYYYISPSGENPVQKFLDSLSEIQQRKITRAISHITEFGIGTHVLNVKKLTGTNLWEIRILGKDNIRVLYATIYKDSVLILHGFLKKKQKTPLKDIFISEKRLFEWKRHMI